MQKSAKRLGRQATLHSSVAKSLSKDCREFEQAFNHVPIATVYEKGEIRTSRLTRASKVVSSMVKPYVLQALMTA